MKKRLKSHYKKQKLLQTAAEGGSTDTYYDYICVVDFEATCEEDNPSDFHHEIIEFPMVLINTHTLEIVSRPSNEIRLSLKLQDGFKNVSPVYLAGGLLPGVCKTGAEPTAVRLLCEVNRNNTGESNSKYYEYDRRRSLY